MCVNLKPWVSVEEAWFCYPELSQVANITAPQNIYNGIIIYCSIHHLNGASQLVGIFPFTDFIPDSVLRCHTSLADEEMGRFHNQDRLSDLANV